MKKKSYVCVNIENQHIVCGGPCDDKHIPDITIISLEPEEIEKVLKKISEERRIKDCYGCNHKVLICKDCEENNELAICGCCIDPLSHDAIECD